MVFPTANDFMNTVREYSIMTNRGIKFKRNENRRIMAVCQENCPWVVFASSIGYNKFDKSLVVKTFNDEHTCGQVFQSKWISSGWLADKCIQKWSDKPSWKINIFFKFLFKP